MPILYHGKLSRNTTPQGGGVRTRRACRSSPRRPAADMDDDAAVGGEGGRPAVTDAEDDVKVSPFVGRHVGEIDSRLRTVGLKRTALQ